MYKKFAKLALLSLIVASNQQAIANTNVKIGHVFWQKTGDVYQEIDVQDIPDNQANVVFIRPATNTDDQSSANISLNNRYLTSLQAEHYSQTFLCSGEATINVQPTADKTNDLNSNSVSLNLEPKKTYYFYVDVDTASNQAILKQIIAENAQMLVSEKSLQTHHISRVINHCEAYIAPEPQNQIIPVEPAPEPQAEEPISLRLDIKFDNNKSNIKPQYSHEVAKVAQLLVQYPTLKAVVEGHTDAQGDDKYNQLLSQRRADAVRFALITQQNIDPNRIQAIGYGESRPIADNNSEYGREQNRRVVVIAQE